MPTTSDSTKPVTLNGQSLTSADVIAVTRHRRKVAIGPAARRLMAASRKVVEASLLDGEAHYGINTGFGSLSRQRIAPKDLAELQRNLIRSHAAGVGPPLSQEIVRGMMLLLAASLCRGMSGVRPAVAELLVAMLNAGVTPDVPEVGSVGASGDLAPLAHLGLVLIGEGFATVGKSRMTGSRALTTAKLRPISLQAKEGLAIINGTHLMAARGTLAIQDFDQVFQAAIIANAMSIDASRGTDSYLDSRVHIARSQIGQSFVAMMLQDLLRGSQIIPSHIENDPRVQDPYCLRCSPQVLGAAGDTAMHVETTIARELGAVTDNPLVFSPLSEKIVGPYRATTPPPTGKSKKAAPLITSRKGHHSIVSAGNFHGMPLAIALDTLAIATAHVAGISERRIFWMLSAFDPESHLKPYLAAGQPGLNSGLMIAQYTAAACVNEIITLCTPASVSNISTSAGIEDYNSFGPRSAAKAARAIDLAKTVVAIELLCAAEGLEYHRPLRSGKKIEAAHAQIRRIVPKLTGDRPPSADIESIRRMISAGSLKIG